MRYWTAGKTEDLHAPMFRRITDLRRYLLAHPECPGALFYTWYHGDLAEVTFQARDQLLAKGAGKAQRGATVSWQCSRGVVRV